MRVPNVRQQGGLSINMTPMIDIVFLLIIFFLVSSHLAKQENRMKLDLPDASTALVDSDLPTTTINVDSDGKWLLAGHVVDANQLRTGLTQRFGDGTKQRIRIRTDRLVPYERVSPILGICGELGITDIVFAVHEPRRGSL